MQDSALTSDAAVGAAGGDETGEELEPDARVADREGLRFAIREYHESEETIRRHQPLMQYLTAQTALPFMIVPRDDYVDMASELAEGKFEFALLSAIEFVRAEELVPELVKLGKPVNAGGVDSYQAVILSRAGDGLHQLGDLRGRVFCYVSRHSNSGFRYPRVMLHRAGVNPDRDFDGVRFGDRHPRTLEMLRQGECDAASVYMNIWDEADDKGVFHIMQTSGPVPNEQYVAHPSVAEADLALVRAALDRLTEGSAEAERVFGPHPQREYFAPHEASDHDGLRDLIRYERQHDIVVHQRRRRASDREP
jgi:phosphonate transport system substrate-binding protein